MRICSSCGTVEANKNFHRCMECGGELIDQSPALKPSVLKPEPIAPVREHPPKPVSSSSSERTFIQLSFFDVAPGDDDMATARFDARDNAPVVWGKDEVPEIIVDATTLRQLRQKQKPVKLFKPARPPMTEKQKMTLHAILLALFLGWSGVHRRYIGDDEAFKAFLLFSLVGGFLTVGVTTILAQLVAVVDAFRLLTGNLEVDPSRKQRGPLKLKTVFSHPA